MTTIDEDEQQEAAPEKSAADSEDERQAKIAKVIDLVRNMIILSGEIY